MQRAESKKPDKEKAILLGVLLFGNTKNESLASIEELLILSKTAHLEIVDQFIQIKKNIDPKYFIGKGKLEELSSEVESHKVDVVIFDNDLSPIQVRNIETILKCKVIGRTELILDIFANRARTKEAKLQVEYAQLSYLYPRLTRRWTHLSRIEGGIGFRGPGETQLEVDRRAIKRRLHVIKKQLQKISVQLETRRKHRKNKNIVCLVGYTNAGKSSLLNYLAKDRVHVDDAYFATLDSTTRKVYISHDLTLLLVDTIGFIKKLPHHLIASFKSTLEEVKSAKLLLHIVDASIEDPLDHIQSVNSILSELNCLEIPSIYVFNKIDKIKNNDLPDKLTSLYEKSCFVSTKTGDGISKLKSMISNFFTH
ncbi:MAG: GTPase HflX [Spirochaetota bacterium]|nr:GTPase HflX [Spirochaetota bacterium]